MFTALVPPLQQYKSIHSPARCYITTNQNPHSLMVFFLEDTPSFNNSSLTPFKVMSKMGLSACTDGINLVKLHYKKVLPHKTMSQIQALLNPPKESIQNLHQNLQRNQD